MGRRPAAELLPTRAIDLVVRNADTILDRAGVRLAGDPASLDLLAASGVRVDGERVRGGLGLLLEIASTAPSTFVQHARDPHRSVVVGGDAPAVTVPVYGPPNVLDDDDADNGGGDTRCRRRPATMADYERLVRLADAADGITNSGHMICVPNDVPEDERYDRMVASHLTLSGKPLMGSTASEASARSSIGLTAAAFAASGQGGVDRADDCRLLFLCNSIPPLTWTDRMLGVLRAAASCGQASLVTSFQMLGATGPVAALGALAQGLAEVSVGLALSQLHRPGAPVVYGTFGIPFDMRTMVPRFAADAVTHQIQSGSVQIARRLGIPALGYGGLTSSKVDDAQSGSESAAATAIAHDVGADVILHAAGWLENGRTAGFAKFVREADALGRIVASGGTGAVTR